MWFIFVFLSVCTNFAAAECVFAYQHLYAHVWKNYSKSAFTDTQKSFLNNNTDVAVARAKDLREFQNPSTSIYKLIEMLKGNAR